MSRLAAAAPVVAVLRSLEHLGGAGRRRLPVLTYHRVLPDHTAAAVAPGLRSADPEGFAEQIAHVAGSWHPVTADDVLAARRGDRELPARAILVTFDDAYRDFAEHAWPVLAAHGVPVVLFVPTGFPDAPARFWWDRVHHALSTTTRRDVRWDGRRVALDDAPARRAAYATVAARVKSLPHVDAMQAVDALVATLDALDPPPSVLGWEELRRLAAEGVTVAPHTRHHPLLDRVAPSALVDELVGARDDIARELGSCPPVLAYPDGHHDEGVVVAAAAAGVEVAFTTRRGVNDLDRCDWLRLSRVNVGTRANVSVLRAQLMPLAGRFLERVG